MIFYVSSILVLLALPALGQSTMADSSFVQPAKQQAMLVYEQAMAKQEHVYEGNEYISHDHRVKIHPYFLTDSLLPGAISYKGASYQNVMVLYDIVRDELSVQPPEGGYRLRLHTDKINDFAIGQHQFIRLVGDSALGLRTGFYEVLYRGKSNVWAHRTKTVHEEIASGTYTGEYLIKDHYYVQKEGTYQEVKTKRSVLTLFPDQAKALRRFIRTNHLNFTNELREAAITGVVRHYDDLTR